MKICCTCRLYMNVEHFNKCASQPDKLSKRCKKCHIIACVKYAKNNPKKLRESYLKSYKKHRVTRLARNMAWARNNPEKVKKIKQRYTSKNIDKIRAMARKLAPGYARKYKIRFPLKIKARSKVNYAIKKGIIPKADTCKCFKCGLRAKDYHHISYEKQDWLKVFPICRKCHMGIHIVNH